MNELNIGIIGGCMTCQTDLKLSQLFFRVLSQKLQDQDKIKCFISLKYYNEYFRIPELAENLVSKSKPDIIILQVRPAPFIMRSEFLIQNYRGRFILNPLIFSSSYLSKIEKILGTKDPVILHKGMMKGFLERKVILPLLEKNIYFGNLFQLRNKALKSLVKIVEDLASLCQEKNVRLVIIGTICSFNSQHNKALRSMSESLKVVASEKGIPYLDIFSLIDPQKEQYFSNDEFHLNTMGHQLVADELYNILSGMILKGMLPDFEKL